MPKQQTVHITIDKDERWPEFNFTIYSGEVQNDREAYVIPRAKADRWLAALSAYERVQRELKKLCGDEN